MNPVSTNIIPNEIRADHLPDGTVGYLNSLGIDHGWGPTSVMQWYFEHLHVWTGLEWGPSIILSGIVFRIICLPLYYKVSENSARMKELKPLMDPYMQEMREAGQRQDTHKLMAVKGKISAMQKKAGANPFKSFLVFVTIPFTFGNFILLRQICHLPVPGMEEQGMSWFTNLTVADPLFILPAISALSLMTTMRVRLLPNFPFPLFFDLLTFLSGQIEPLYNT